MSHSFILANFTPKIQLQSTRTVFSKKNLWKNKTKYWHFKRVVTERAYSHTIWLACRLISSHAFASFYSYARCYTFMFTIVLLQFSFTLHNSNGSIKNRSCGVIFLAMFSSTVCHHLDCNISQQIVFSLAECLKLSFNQFLFLQSNTFGKISLSSSDQAIYFGHFPLG